MSLIRVLLVVLVLGIGCDRSEPQPAATDASQVSDTDASRAWQAMTVREEALRALGPALRELDRSVMNLTLPDANAHRRFGVTIVSDDLGSPGPPTSISAVMAKRRVPIVPAGPPRSPKELALWRPVLDGFDHFLHAHFAVVSGDFVNDQRRQLDTLVRFGAAGVRPDGSVASLSGRFRLLWERPPSGELDDSEAWKLVSWSTHAFGITEADAAMFHDVLDAALDDPVARRNARESRHARFAVARLQDPESFQPPHEHFFVGSQDRHPGVSVLDVNGDGLDDIYVMARFGPNQLFVNLGDGRFEERAEAYGLALEDHSAAAIFADFDNDGDPDAFIGRTLAPSVYLENEAGHFVDRSQTVLDGAPLPSLVSSVAAADIDADGLLDIYVSTYAAQMLVAELVAKDRKRRELGIAPATELLESHLSQADAEALMAATREAGSHEFLSLPGPPNLLLRNTGEGRFVAAPDGPLRTFRNTFQSTFGDYDGDGDPDLYLAHDFSPNQLLRNEGEGRFLDITQETGTADVGFGMGASWGDYDRDGREDLYVSNMYSKAGKRITSSFESADPRLSKMARGNTLFRNTGELFDVVSGEEPPALTVEDAGWSWGGQFLDVDSDGFLDLFALSGYYTAPTDVESFVDT